MKPLDALTTFTGCICIGQMIGGACLAAWQLSQWLSGVPFPVFLFPL